MKTLLVGYRAADLTPELLEGDVTCHVLENGRRPVVDLRKPLDEVEERRLHAVLREPLRDRLLVKRIVVGEEIGDALRQIGEKLGARLNLRNQIIPPRLV